MQSKVEICGVNTAKLTVLKNEQTNPAVYQPRRADG